MKRHDQGDRRSNPWWGVALPIAALLSCVVSVLHVVPNRYTKNAAGLKRGAIRFSPQIPHPTSGMRPVYPFSVIPGGAYSAAELRNKLSADAVAARHYQKFQLAQVSSIETQSASLVYVSYRKGSSIYWTQKPIRLARGEKLITDGVLYARARCGNRISTTPEHPVALLEPPDYIFERPETWQPDIGPLPPPPDQPVESRSRTPETISALPSNPVRETVAKKRPPFLPLFPFPLRLARVVAAAPMATVARSSPNPEAARAARVALAAERVAARVVPAAELARSGWRHCRWRAVQAGVGR